ncbi:hypothetical protein L3X38_011182 [Prunus dulcis]|uniref:Uncharacterized protein n=1 Tax=Prunus dulcis TaxID=3755 RepID=A0AAD4WJE4_PRUDU|nr:hypothetical protein L3X38_011182 [Prunus dulcis]
MGSSTMFGGSGGATMSIAGSWVEWLWAVADRAIVATLPLVFMLPTMVVWKASVDWKIGGTDFLIGMSLRFFLDLGFPTCINVGLLFTLLHIANLTSLLSSLREILENLYCLSKRGVVVHPKEECSARLLSKKDGRHVKSSRNEATTLLAKDATRLRKKARIHYAEKTQVRAVLPPSARFKHLVGADSKKIDGIRDVRDVPLESSTDKLGDRDLLHEVVCTS